MTELSLHLKQYLFFIPLFTLLLNGMEGDSDVGHLTKRARITLDTTHQVIKIEEAELKAVIHSFIDMIKRLYRCLTIEELYEITSITRLVEMQRSAFKTDFDERAYNPQQRLRIMNFLVNLTYDHIKGSINSMVSEGRISQSFAFHIECHCNMIYRRTLRHALSLSEFFPQHLRDVFRDLCIFRLQHNENSIPSEIVSYIHMYDLDRHLLRLLIGIPYRTIKMGDKFVPTPIGDSVLVFTEMGGPTFFTDILKQDQRISLPGNMRGFNGSYYRLTDEWVLYQIHYGSDRPVQSYDLQTGAESIFTMSVEEKNSIRTAALSRGLGTMSTYKWNMLRDDEILDCAGLRLTQDDVFISPDQKYKAIIGLDNGNKYVEIYGMSNDRTPVIRISLDTGESFCWSASGRYFIVAHNTILNDEQVTMIKFWDSVSWKILTTVELPLITVAAIYSSEKYIFVRDSNDAKPRTILLVSPEYAQSWISLLTAAQKLCLDLLFHTQKNSFALVETVHGLRPSALAGICGSITSDELKEFIHTVFQIPTSEYLILRSLLRAGSLGFGI